MILRALIILLSAALFADQPAGPAAGETRHETEQETITKCLGDLTLADNDKRLRAILILGKYKTAPATMAVLSALGDKHAPVRQAALVSLTETPVIPSFAYNGLLRRLMDADVNIRRLAASHAPTIYSRLRRVRLGKPLDELDKLNDQIVLSAFADEDVVVRRNLYDKFSILRPPAGAAQLLAGLKDPDREIRSLTIRNANMLSEDAMVEAVGPLATDEDANIRREVVRVLRGRAKAKPIMEALAEDADVSIRAEATLNLIMLGDKERTAELLELLGNPALDQAIGIRFVRSTVINAKEPILSQLLQHTRAPYREAAVSTWLQARGKGLAVERLWPFFEDHSSQIRQRAGMYTKGADWTAGELEKLATSQYSDVRAICVRLAAQKPPEVASAIIEELLFDDSDAVREAAVQHILSLQLADWAMVAEDVLETNEFNLRGWAIGTLRSKPKGRELLTELQDSTSDHALAAAIGQALKLRASRARSAVQPNVRVLQGPTTIPTTGSTTIRATGTSTIRITSPAVVPPTPQKTTKPAGERAWEK